MREYHLGLARRSRARLDLAAPKHRHQVALDLALILAPARLALLRGSVEVELRNFGKGVALARCSPFGLGIASLGDVSEPCPRHRPRCFQRRSRSALPR